MTNVARTVAEWAEDKTCPLQFTTEGRTLTLWAEGVTLSATENGRELFRTGVGAAVSTIVGSLGVSPTALAVR